MQILKRQVASWSDSLLFVLTILVAATMGCQELPTEPTPIDLSKDQPVAVDDQVSTPEETPIRIKVLDNDMSLVEDDLVITEIVTEPRFGVAVIDGDVISYVAEENYNGSDSLRYKVSGGVLSATAKVVITVTPVNDPPVASDDAFTVAESIALPKAQATVLDVLANDVDVDGDQLRIIRTGPSTRGSIEIASDGLTLSYMPNVNFNGVDQFDYTIADGNGGQDLATVVVTVTAVNDAPTVRNKLYAGSEDTPRSENAPGVLLQATDPEGDALTAVLVTDVSHGTLVLSQDGGFVYTPDQDFFGEDRFEFAASDGLSQSQPATAILNVISVNDPPVAAADEYSVDEDITLDVPAPGILANDVDVDGDALTITLISGTSSGSLDVRGDGSFSYIPDAGSFGTDMFEYRIDDGTLASTAIVTINVGMINDSPIGTADQYAIGANLPLIEPAPGVLENDSDEEGDPLSALLITPPAGDLNLSSGGGFDYLPPAGFSGTDTFVYRASDGNSVSELTSVIILVSAVGNPPVAVNDSYEMAANEVLEVDAPGVLANDSDEDLDVLLAELESDVIEGTLELNSDGSFRYTPLLDFVGSVSFTYRAKDGPNVSPVATVTINISD